VEARFGLPETGNGLAAVSGDGPLMTVDQSILRSLSRPAEAWQQMRPFPRYAWEVDRLTVGERSWEKDVTGGWGDRLDRAVELLTGLEARELAVVEGLKPDFTVSLGAEELEIRFPEDLQVIGRRPGADICYLIDTPHREELLQILVDLQSME
jgi:hypothetical protein